MVTALKIVTSLALTLTAGVPLDSEQKNLAIGDFVERHKKVRGHAKILSGSIVWHLSRDSQFQIVTDKAGERAANRAIVKNNRDGTREDDWVEIGSATGVDHLLFGELWYDKGSCLAMVRIIELETKKESARSMPELYNCSLSELRALSTGLYRQLTGRVKGTKTPRAVIEPPPLEIKIEGDRFLVGKKALQGRASSEEKAQAPGSPKTVELMGEKKPSQKLKQKRSSKRKKRPAATKVNSKNELANTQKPPSPAATPPPPKPPAPKPEPYTIQQFLEDVNTHRQYVVAFYLMVPFLTLLIGGLLRGVDADKAVRVLKSGIRSSLILLVLHGIALAVASLFLEVDVFEYFDITVLGSPVLGFIGTLSVSRIVSYRKNRFA